MHQRLDVSWFLFSVDVFRLLPGLSSPDTGAEACHARSPTKVYESAQITRLLAPLPDAKRPSRVSPCQRSVIRCPTPKVGSCLKNVTMPKSLEALAREVARVQGKPAAMEEDSEISDENGPLPVPKSAWVVSGHRHHHLRMLVDHLVCRNGRSEELLLERGGARSLAARRNYQTDLRDVPQIC